MNRVKRIISIVFALAVVADAACGQDISSNINPALLYYQAFILEPTYNQADHDFLWTNNWGPDLKMPDRMGEVLAASSNSFAAMNAAGHSTVPCDWGIDVSKGPDTLLPYLARAKQLVVTDQLRIMWELQNGQEKEARDDLLSVYTLGRNTSQDGTLIGVLVDFAIENVAISTIAQYFHSFSPETLQQLINGLDAAPHGRTVANAMITGERNLLVDWVGRKLADLQKEYPNNDAAIIAKLQEFAPNMEDASSNVWKQAFSPAANPASIQQMVNDGDAAFQKASEILALPYGDFLPQAKQFQADVDKSSNALVAISMPAIMKAKTKEFREQIMLAMLRAAIAYKTHGNAGFLSVNDPGGSGPFQTSRFMFNGVDRGFKLTSAFSWEGHPETMIFVESEGPAFKVYGPHAGEPLSK